MVRARGRRRAARNMSYGGSSGRGGQPAARGSKRRISEEEWTHYRRTIEYFYLDEGKDVKDVRNTMMRDYGFEAHEKAYKRKFEEWGIVKNIPKDEGLFMVKKREERREEGKNTVFRRRRRPDGPYQLVSDEKIDRIADRYAHDLANWPEDADEPDNIEYSTPPGEVAPAYSHIGQSSVSAASGWPATTAEQQQYFDPAYMMQQQQHQADASVQQHYGQWPAASGAWTGGYFDPNDPAWQNPQ